MKSINNWARRNGVTLFTESNKPDLIGFYISHENQTFQVVLELRDKIRVDVWSIETNDDEDIHKVYFVEPNKIQWSLNIILAAILEWFSHKSDLPATI